MKNNNETSTPKTDNETTTEPTANSSQNSTPVFEPSAGENRVFTVPSDGGEITTCYRQVAVDDCTGEIFNKETVESMLDNGEAVFSENFYYSMDRGKLVSNVNGAFAPGDDNTDSPETAAHADNSDIVEDVPVVESEDLQADPEPVKLPENGDLVCHIKKGTFALYYKAEDGTETVEISEGSTGNKKVKAYKAKDWRRATDDEFWSETTNQNLDQKPQTAIEKVPAVIEGEVITGEPLTAKERKTLAKLEEDYDKVDAIERQVPFEKGKILNSIRAGKLYRETHNTFGEYAFARFGITRVYAQNLAQIANVPELAAEALEAGVEVAMSINTANRLMRDTNSIGKALGIGSNEFEALAPVFRNTLAIMASVAPKDRDGNLELTPRFVSSFNDVLADHITDGVVEIAGEQMTIKAAGERGLLNASLRSEVIEAAAEGIKRQEEIIRSDWQKREAGIVPVLGAGNASKADPAVKYYKGKVPVLNTECSLHGDTEILAISNGKFETRCGCRWHMDADKGELMAFEVNELPVKR